MILLLIDTYGELLMAVHAGDCYIWSLLELVCEDFREKIGLCCFVILLNCFGEALDRHLS